MLFLLLLATKNLINSKKLKIKLKKIVVPTELLNHKSDYIDKGSAYYFPKQESDFSTKIKYSQSLNEPKGTVIITKTLPASQGIIFNEESESPKETEPITTKLLIHPQYELI